ncbi:transmembrane protein [Rhynchospora pubera]|uniref:Transmembrane protein n=1 Tax=Rhynchospora pubera TaxID=906938 RepID=A0AAV8END8_9POAL|nr:transmembrane protein [Rhynchospora pubera]
MDLDEWEVIPSTKPYHYVSSNELLSYLGPDLLVEADYFRCPTPGLSPSEHQQEEEEEEEEEAEEEEMPKEFKDIGISTEFRKETRSPAPAHVPAPASPVNWLEPDPMVFSQGTIMTEKEEAVQMQMERKKEVVVEEEKDCAGFNLWGLSVHGIGAICSFGVATAATLCVFALSTASATCRVRPSPNIQFQIFSDDKRIKDVVQRAPGLNHAMTAARGITIPTAQISFGGHYEGL